MRLMFLLRTLPVLVLLLIPASWPLCDAPDSFVLVAIAVVGIEDIVRATIELDVVHGDQVNGRHVPARRRASEGAVHLVDRLPAVQIERFWNGGGLKLPLANAVVRRHAAVAAGNHLRWATGGSTQRPERWNG